ncbi:hypothetical protein [Streptomyces sp. NPDC002054]|uniref:hypothetical protein n=1 Tax=Streptomyces sp. NPDC002054 TaxID=3154663 RepID=UPI0033331251
MQRGLVHGLAWTLATGAAVTLSWWGVHSVMSGTAYDRPKAIPLTSGALSSSTHSTEPPPPPPSPTPSAPSSAPSASSTPAASPSPKPPKKSPPGTRPRQQPDGKASGTVKGYTVDGGRVVFDLGESSAELVSATPAAGWQMQVWKQPKWIRVTFTRDGREVSVFCVWNDHPPRVDVWDA